MTPVRPPVTGSVVDEALVRKRLDTHGKVIGNYVAKTNNSVTRPFLYDAGSDSSVDIGPADAGISALAFSISDSGVVVGAAYLPREGGTVPSAFAWSRAGGFLPIDPERNEGSFAYWTTDAGMVGGETVDAAKQECTGAFRWDVVSRAFTRYAHFCPHTMNAAGAMAGKYTPPDGQPYLAVLEIDGTVRPLLPGSAIDGEVRFLMDDGNAVIDVECGNQILISAGKTSKLKPGLVSPPSQATESTEVATINAVSRSNLAVGLDQIFWSRPGMGGTLESGFVWSEGTGVLPMNVGSDSANPVAVNGAGIAVGYTPSLGAPQRAFVWTRASGSVLLDDRVMNLPADTRISGAIEIGEGGHILAVTGDDRYVVLAPQQ
jgi:hypothetical protein